MMRLMFELTREVAAGGSAGALLAAPLSDFLGRKYAVASMAFLFLVGCAMQEIPHLEVFYAGRLLGGIAIGATSMLAPQYLAEVCDDTLYSLAPVCLLITIVAD
jgi:MFS family permease